MTIAMCWLIPGALMVAAGLTWAFGPFGLCGAGLLVFAFGVLIAPSTGGDG